MELRAVLLNCTLKASPEPSNTQALMDIATGHLESLGVECETIRVVDHNIPFGVDSDLGEGDEWPPILEKILAADILIMGMSIWFGVRCSVAQMVIERLDGTYNTTNDVGQYPMYNKVAGVVVTGNEDGAHASAETTLFNLTHLGFTVPPNADTYWVGDAGPGPSFIDAGGASHPYTRKTASWMAHNVVHMARILKANPIPPEGNTVPMTGMTSMMSDMAPGQEKRMIPVLMESGDGQAPRRWWRSIGRH
jgi:multimeric flavodoxin WrbA